MERAASCPACGAGGSHPPYRTFPWQDREYVLKQCRQCGSLFYDPLHLVDYRAHTADPVAVRDYVELNASLEDLAGFAMELIGERAGGRLLDIGCGYGFAADAARRLGGWTAIGVEPSPYGGLGAEQLGLTVIRDYVDEHHPIAAERFDLILACEVVEHLEEPVKLLSFLRGLLTPAGQLALTVPAADAVSSPKISESQRLAALSPGAHALLFSEPGLAQALRRAGFAQIEIGRNGVSLCARASAQPLPPLAPVSRIEVAARYAEAVLASGITDPSLRAGLAYRRFRYLIELGRHAEAEAILDGLEKTNLHLASEIDSFAGFLAAYRSYAAVELYYRGILELNHRHRFLFANALFLASHLLCILKIRVAPSLAVVESGLVWSAYYHAAAAAARAGRSREAAWMVLRLCLPLDKGLPPVPRSLRFHAAGRIGGALRRLVLGRKKRP